LRLFTVMPAEYRYCSKNAVEYGAENCQDAVHILLSESASARIQ